MNRTTLDIGLLERAVRRLPDDALAPLRKAALERFAESGFPTTRHEDWRYTNLAPAIELSNRWLRGVADGTAAPSAGEFALQRAAELATGINAHWIVIANGVLQRDSLAQFAAQGVVATAVDGSVALPASLDAPAEEPMTGFNTALLQDVLHLSVTERAEPGKPIVLLMVDEAEGDHTALSQARVLVDVAANARAELIEYHVSSGGGDHFANVVVELDLGERAAIDYVRIQDRQLSHYQVGRLVARLRRDSTFNHAAFDFGGALVRNDVIVDIAEPGASAGLQGLYLAAGRQHIDNHTRVDHRVGPAGSSEEYRGILAERARCVWNGKAIVHKGADGTDAHQANHNLLLSDKAEIDTKPELEIYADDVKCSHGATVGQLDKRALFYLRSRGLSRDEAAQLLTRAFAEAIVAKTTVHGVRQHLESLLVPRLRALGGGVA